MANRYTQEYENGSFNPFGDTILYNTIPNRGV